MNRGSGNCTCKADTSATAKAEPFEHLIQCSMHQTPYENASSCNTLNDDCLVEIFKRMTTNDLILVGCLCEHCLELIKKCVFPWRSIDMDEVIKMYDIREVFKQFGSDIRDLSIHRRHINLKSSSSSKSKKSDSQKLLEMLIHNCPKDTLKKLDISLNFNDIDATRIALFSLKLQDVRDLIVTASHFNYGRPNARSPVNNNNNQNMEILLQYADKLKTIRINMMSISGEFLYRTPIKHLTELVLEQCHHIHVDAFVESAAHFKCLTTIVWQNSQFDGMSSISENISTFCDILGRDFKTVEMVTVSMNYGLKYCHNTNGGHESILDGLKRLPHLKHLTVGLAGACACNNFYGVIQQLQQIQSLAIESPPVFAGRYCLPCIKIIANYLPNILGKFRHLTSFRIVHVNSHRTEHLFNEIIDKLKHIEQLQLIGIQHVTEENLEFLIQNLEKLKILVLYETKFRFTSDFYVKLVNECQKNKRHLYISVSQCTSVQRKLLASLKNVYRKEYVQIAISY